METSNDPTAHAEMLCIRSAAAQLGGWRLTVRDVQTISRLNSTSCSVYIRLWVTIGSYYVELL